MTDIAMIREIIKIGIDQTVEWKNTVEECNTGQNYRNSPR